MAAACAAGVSTNTSPCFRTCRIWSICQEAISFVRREPGRGELGPLDVPRPMRRDSERPPRATRRFEPLPHPWEATYRPRDAVDVLAREVAGVVAEPERLPQMDEVRRIGSLSELFTDAGLRALRQYPRPREVTGPVL